MSGFSQETSESKRTEVLAAVEALPPLPAVALRVMQVAQSPKSSASDLALVVSADPGLSARILRIVNSAAYRRSREITSVQEALVMLGFVQARNVAISGAIGGAYSPAADNALFRIQAFWRHALGVAFMAADLASRGSQVDAPSAFTTGILHNIGRLAMFYADPVGLDQAVAEAIRSGRTLEAVEAELLGYDHSIVGGMLAKRWQLPATIAEAVAHHHEPQTLPDSLGGVVARADEFCTMNRLLPGYVVAPPAGAQTEPTPEFAKLMKQVDSLMELVQGPSAGVAAA